MYKKMSQVIVFLVTVSGGSVFASTLDVYQDGAKYRTVPVDRFVGFVKGASATCDGERMPLVVMQECPSKQRLCQEVQQIETLLNEKEALAHESQTLEKLISLSKPTEIDAGKWIEAAQKIGKHTSALLAKQKKANEALHVATTSFARQAPSRKAVGVQKKCAGEQELTLPAGMIGAKLLYEADTSNPTKISVKQYIALSNHSGVDIVAKEANLYARSYRVYLRPQQFSPWIASIRQDYRVRKSLKKNKQVYAESATADTVMAAVEPTVSMKKVVQTGYKNYHITGLELPSTGEETRVKIADYVATASCELISYSYMDSRVYRTCSFAPQSPIESHQWRIQKNKRLVSDQAYGEYREGRYRLNVDIDDEILVQRKPVVKKDRSSGIFGGSIRKKDGFELALTSLSSQTKTVKIIERIPTSTTDKIKVKLLKVEGASSHKLLPEGRLEIEVTLPPKASQKIKVLFELSYDKETKVHY